jgi:hypothetical protein
MTRPNRPKRTPIKPWQGNQDERHPAEITHVCGHVSIIQVYGSPDRSSYARQRASEPCTDCRDAEARDIDEAAVERGHRVDLDGGPRQRPWAAAIRQQRAMELTVWFSALQATAVEKTRNGSLTEADADEAINDARTACQDLMLGVEFDTVEEVNHSGLAKWWIDSRKMPIEEIIRMLVPDRSPVPEEFLAPLWHEPEDTAPEAPEPVIRTATPLPGTAPAPYNPHANRAAPRPARRQPQQQASPFDLGDDPF